MRADTPDQGRGTHCRTVVGLCRTHGGGVATAVRSINMSSEPGNESFFGALRSIPRILSLQRRDETNQVKIGKPSRRRTISGCSCAPVANRYGGVAAVDNGYVRSQLA